MERDFASEFTGMQLRPLHGCHLQEGTESPWTSEVCKTGKVECALSSKGKAFMRAPRLKAVLEAPKVTLYLHLRLHSKLPLKPGHTFSFSIKHNLADGGTKRLSL